MNNENRTEDARMYFFYPIGRIGYRKVPLFAVMDILCNVVGLFYLKRLFHDILTVMCPQ